MVILDDLLGDEIVLSDDSDKFSVFLSLLHIKVCPVDRD